MGLKKVKTTYGTAYGAVHACVIGTVLISQHKCLWDEGKRELKSEGWEGADAHKFILCSDTSTQNLPRI